MGPHDGSYDGMGERALLGFWKAPGPVREPVRNDPVTMRCWRCLGRYEARVGALTACPHCTADPRDTPAKPLPTFSGPTDTLVGPDAGRAA